jgi:PAS domain S-box-containing protein
VSEAEQPVPAQGPPEAIGRELERRPEPLAKVNGGGDRDWLSLVAPEANDDEVGSVRSTAELRARPPRPPDHAAENRALVALARVLAASPYSILQKPAETALTLCGAHSAGLSLLEEGDWNFHWRAIAGQWASHLGGGTPRDFGPCGTVLARNASQVFSHPERDFPYFVEVTPYVEDGLLIPFYIGGEAVGTIWVISHDQSRRFEAEDLRVMTSLGTFAGAAYRTMLSLKATIDANQELQRSADELHRFASIVDSSTDAIVSKTLDGVITSWNKGAEQIFGHSADEAIGKPVSILIPERDEEPSILERVARGERIDTYDTVRQRKDGSLIDISLTVSPCQGYSGQDRRRVKNRPGHHRPQTSAGAAETSRERNAAPRQKPLRCYRRPGGAERKFRPYTQRASSGGSGKVGSTHTRSGTDAARPHRRSQRKGRRPERDVA